MSKAILPIPTELDDAWSRLRSQIMGNPNSVINDTNDWVGWFMEGFNEAVWPRNPAEAGAYGAMGLAPAVTTAIPKPFKSEWLERIKKYAPSFPKKATGQEILEQLEAKGILPKGYGEYYGPKSKSIEGPDFLNPLHPDNLRIGPSPNHPPGYYAILDAEGNNVTGRVIPGVEAGTIPETLRFEIEQYGKYRKPPNTIIANTLPEQLQRDQLVPYLEENWVNPRIDVRSRSGARFLNDLEGDYGLGQPTFADPRHSGSQTIFNDLADDYFELLVKPRRGLDIPTPDKLASGGHWNDPSVMTHVRGETVGPRAIVQEVQGDWNRTYKLAQQLARAEIVEQPISSRFSHLRAKPRSEFHIFDPVTKQVISKHDSFIDAKSQLDTLLSGLGNVPPLPPELLKAWPEVGAKAALSYAARQPNLQRVSFVDDLIAASARNLDPEKTKGIYGDRLPQFLRKYVPRYGGEYRVEPFYERMSIGSDGLPNAEYPLSQIFQDLYPEGSRLWNESTLQQLSYKIPEQGKFHTIELGDWNSPFRKFLRGQQPLAVAPAVPLGMGLFTGDEEYQ